MKPQPQVRPPPLAPPAPEIDDLTLRRAKDGDRQAFRALIDRYQVPVYALLYRMLRPGGREAALDDLAQETFVRVFTGLPRFSQEGPARLSTWILTIATRLAISELRRLTRREVPLPATLPAGGDRADAQVQRHATEQTVQRAIAGLAPDHRAVLLLREFHGLEYQEIADALQIDLGTVRSRLFRARAALREALTEVPHG